MKLEAANYWVLVRIKDHRNMILTAVKVKCIYLRGVFGHFGVLLGAPGVMDAGHSLPGCC